MHSLLEKQRLAKRMIVNPTEAERALYSALMQANVNFYKQHISHGYILDAFLIDSRVAIECDGGYHSTHEQQMYDIERDSALKKDGITVLRFVNEEVLANPMAIISRLKKLKYIKPRRKHRQYES